MLGLERTRRHWRIRVKHCWIVSKCITLDWKREPHNLVSPHNGNPADLKISVTLLLTCVLYELKCCFEEDKIRRTTWSLEHAMWCEHSFKRYIVYVTPSTSCCKSFPAQDTFPGVSAHITSSPTGWILMKLHIGKRSKMCRENRSLFKMRQNIWHFMCRPRDVLLLTTSFCH